MGAQMRDIEARIPPRGLSSWPSPSEAEGPAERLELVPLPERLSPVMKRGSAVFYGLED